MFIDNFSTAFFSIFEIMYFLGKFIAGQGFIRLDGWAISNFNSSSP